MTLRGLRHALAPVAMVFALTVGLPNRVAADDSPPAGALGIDSVSWYFKPESAFKRITEFFGGAERTGHRLILRTDADARAGLYFVLRTSAPLSALPVGSSVELQFIEAGDPHPRRVRMTLPADGQDGRREIWFGFTGADTPARDRPPVAWSATLLDATGKPVAERNSFLWAME